MRSTHLKLSGGESGLVCPQYQTLIFSTRSLEKPVPEKPVLNGWAFSAIWFQSPNLVLKIIEGDSLKCARAKPTANFGTELDPVDDLNGIFEEFFGGDDGGALKRARAVSALKGGPAGGPLSNLYLEIVPGSAPLRPYTPAQIEWAVDAETGQNHPVVELIRRFEPLHHRGGPQKRARSRMFRFFLIFAARVASL